MLDFLLPLLLALSPSTAQAEIPTKPDKPAVEAEAPAAAEAKEDAPAPAPAAAPSQGEGLHLAIYEPFGVMPDAPAEFQLNFMALDEPEPTSLFDLTRTFQTIRDDDTVPVVVLDTKDADIGLSQVQSIRREFTALRASGKQVWMYFDAVDLGSLLLAGEASKACGAKVEVRPFEDGE